MTPVTGVTLAQIVYDIMSLRRGVLSDDDSLDKRQVEFWVQNWRSILIRQEYGKNRTLSENIIQDLGCVELETADRAECCDLDVGCTIRRTKLEIPKPIELQQKDGIMRVGPIDKLHKAFSFVPYEQAIYSGNGRFNKYEVFAFLRNKRIYLKFNGNNITYIAMKYVNIRGIFENPKQAEIFKSCDGTPCYTSNSAYPISNWMVEFMKQQVINTNFKTLYAVPGDTSNDAAPQPDGVTK